MAEVKYTTKVFHPVLLASVLIVIKSCKFRGNILTFRIRRLLFPVLSQQSSLPDLIPAARKSCAYFPKSDKRVSSA